MSYQKDRDEFVAVIVAEVGGPTVRRESDSNGTNERIGRDAVALARLILRNAATIQRIATAACNREMTHHMERQEAACRHRIINACKPWGIMPRFSGDPRGACVKLILPSGRYNSWGGAEKGFCVPTR